MTCKLEKGALNHILLCFLFIVIFAYIVITINDKCSRENFLVDSLANSTSLDDFYGKKDRVLEMLKSHKGSSWNSGKDRDAGDLGNKTIKDDVEKMDTTISKRGNHKGASWNSGRGSQNGDSGNQDSWVLSERGDESISKHGNHRGSSWNSGEDREASDLRHTPELNGVDAELRGQLMDYEGFNNQPTYQSNYEGENISDSVKQTLQQSWNTLNQSMNQQQSSQVSGSGGSGNPINNNGTNSRDTVITPAEQKELKQPMEEEEDEKEIIETPQRKTVIVNNHYYGSNKEVNDFIKELKEQKNNDENQFMLDMGQCGQLNNDLSSTKLADYKNARLRQEITEQKCRKAGYGKAQFSPSQSQTALIGTLLSDAKNTQFGSIITHDPMRKKIKYERLANMDAREGISAN